MQERAAHSLGIASMLLGLLALSFSWIPGIGLFGLPFSVGGLLVAAGGIAVSCTRRGSGIGYSLAGALISAVAVAYALLAASRMPTLPLVRVNERAIEPIADEPESPPAAVVWTPANQPLHVGEVSVRIGTPAVRHVKTIDHRLRFSNQPRPLLGCAFFGEQHECSKKGRLSAVGLIHASCGYAH